MIDSLGAEITNVACVVVTYNNGSNIERLTEVLLAQTKRVEGIVVVDNGSSDNTAEIVRERFPRATLLANACNGGVGGGYAEGMEYAYKSGYQWTWLLDGDSLPQASALEELAKAFFTRLKRTHPRIGILASSPVDSVTGQRWNGFLWRGRFVSLPAELACSKEPFPVDSTISSGCLVCRRVIDDVGLPRADFFMDFVDHEYNLRIRRAGYEIIFVPASINYHEIGKPRVIKPRIIRAVAHLTTRGPLGIEAPWRQYYMVRNEVYTFWHEFRNYRALFFCALGLVRMIVGMFLFSDKDKAKRIKYVALGLRDGFGGRLGTTVTPS